MPLDPDCINLTIIYTTVPYITIHDVAHPSRLTAALAHLVVTRTSPR